MSDRWRPDFMRSSEEKSRRRSQQERMTGARAPEGHDPLTCEWCRGEAARGRDEPPGYWERYTATEEERRRRRERPSHVDVFAGDYFIDPARERALSRARKIKALADRPGTVDEGKAAKAMLARFLKANGLSAREL